METASIAEARTEAKGSSSGIGGGKGTPVVIDDRTLVPEGKYLAAVRLIALLGSGKHFAGDGPRSAWQWVVRLHDGTHGTVTHLVNHNRCPIHVFAAALTGDKSLLGKVSHCDANQVIARAAMVEVRHRTKEKREPQSFVADAWPLPAGVEPIVLSDTCVWTPASKKPLPRYAPQWVRIYADGAVAQHWLGRKAATP